MIALSVKHLSLSFSGEEVLKDVSFALGEGERAALVGTNGAGKSTLLKILSGALAPDGGEVFVAGSLRVGMLDQHALEDSEKTVLQEALSAHEELLKTEAELNRLQEKVSAGDLNAASRLDTLSRAFERDGGLTYLSRTKSALSAVSLLEMANRCVSTLSGGQKTTLALVKLLLNPPDILLLDEPTNHLDIRALSWLEDTVKNLSCTVLCVSHDRMFLDRAFPKVLELFAGRCEEYNCSYSRYREERRARREVLEKHYALQQKEIERQEEVIRRLKSFNREKSVRRAESREKALAKMERLERPDAERDTPSFSFESLPSPKEVLRIRDLSFSYPDAAIFSPFDAEVDAGERVFFIGSVGSGKSTLLKTIAGRLPAASGSVRRGPGLSAGYYDQENQDLNRAGTVFDEIFSLDGEDSQGQTRNYLAAFGFCGDKVFQKVDTLSGGERARLSLAKLMRRRHNLLFLDEPTNHLDMDSKEALEEALLQYPGTCVIVSHDRYFIKKLATKVFFIERSRAPRRLMHGVENLEELYAKRENAAEQKKDSEQKKAYLARKKHGAEERRRQAALRNTERAIGETEERIAELEEAYNAATDDYKRLQELYAEREAAEVKLEELYETLFSLQEEE